MKITLKDVVREVTPQTPVKATVPSHWLPYYEGFATEVTVEICGYVEDSDSIQFSTLEHGHSARVSSCREVEVDSIAPFSTVRLRNNEVKRKGAISLE